MQLSHGSSSLFKVKSLIAFLLLCTFAAQVQATFDPVNDDTDIFLANPNVPAQRPNVLLIIDNSANWGPVFDNEKAALVKVIQGLGDQFDVGTELFAQTGSGNDNIDGGQIRFAIRQMTDTNKTVLSNMYNNFTNASAANGGDKSNNAVPGLAMLEAYRYFSGGHPYASYGKIKTDYTGNATHETVTPTDLGGHALPSNPNALSNFNSPIIDPCQDNFIIYISNGPASENSTARAVSEQALSALGYDTSTTIAISPNGQEGNWMDEWADYMSNADVSSTLAGNQHVYTYVVEVDPSTTGQGPDMTALLKSAANKGKGAYYAVSGGNGGSAIVDALNNIFSEIQAINSVFASTTLPVSVNVRGTNLNQVYIGVFRPDAHKKPRWYGNLKMYKLGYNSTTNTLFLEDALNNEAENPATGFINSTAESFWTTSSNFWSYRPSSENGDGGASDLPDGDLVEKGGAAEMLRIDYATDQSTRQLYTCNTTSTKTCSSGDKLSDFPFSTANDGITAADLDLATIDVATLSAAENKTVTKLTDSLPVSSLDTSPVGGSVPISLSVPLNNISISSITTKVSHTITAIADGLTTLSFSSLDYLGAQNKSTASATTTTNHNIPTGTCTTYPCPATVPVLIDGVTDTNYDGLETATSNTLTVTGANTFTYVPTGSNLTHISQSSTYSSATASFSTTGNIITITSANHGLSAGDSISISGVTPTSYNGNYQVIQVIDANTFTVQTATTLAPITSVAGATFSAFTNTATVTTAAAHNFANGSYVKISGVTSQTVYNGTWQITTTGTNTFTYNVGTQLPDVTNEGTAIQASTNTITATVTSGTNTFVAGQSINISGGIPSGYNGAVTVVSSSGNTFTYNAVDSGGNPVYLPPNTGTSVTASSGYSNTARLSITNHNLWPLGDALHNITIRVEGVTGIDGGTGSAADYDNGGNDITATIVDDNTLTYSIQNSADRPGPALGTITVRVKDSSGNFVAFATIPSHGYGTLPIGPDGIWNTADDVAGGTQTLSISGANNSNYNLTGVTAHVLTSDIVYYPLTTTAQLGDDTGTSIIASRKTETAVATAVAHGFSTGNQVQITGATPSVFDNTWTVTVTGANTFTFNLAEHSVAAQGDATGTIKASTGTAASGELADIINWVRGADNFEDENNNGNTTDVRASIHGDVLHSRPAIINYNRFGNDNDVYVFYGSNDGIFRAVKGGFQQADPSEPLPGHEAWGFIPEEFFPKLKRLRNNSPIISSSNKKPYFADGSIGVLAQDNSGPGGEYVPDGKIDTTVDNNANPDRAYIYITMRRGGRLLYALDVSDPRVPRFMWKITNSTDGFAELGETWSAPRVINVKGYPNPVVIFGAGYDANIEDIPPSSITSVNMSNGSVTANGTTTPRSMGRGIFLIDAYTGKLLWEAGVPGGSTGTTGAPYVSVPNMIYAIPSDITVIKIGNYDDRAYVGDTGGNVWRIDMPDADSNGDGNPDFKAWTITKLADVVPDDSPTCTTPCNPITIPTDLRKFEQAPDVVLAPADTQYPNGYYAVLLGSGDREHPFDTTVQNRFYMFKDPVNPTSSTSPLIDQSSYDANGTNSLSTNSPTLVEGNLYNATTDCIDNQSACGSLSSLVDTSYVNTSSSSNLSGLTGSSTVTSSQAATLATLASGWYITLNPGEKVTGDAVTLNKVTFFNTNQPSTTSSSSDCSSDLGIARQYQVTFSDATAFADKPGGLAGKDALDRQTIHAGGGYLPSPVPLVVSINGQVHEGVISGVSVAQPPGSLLNARLRKFWYREMDSP